MSALRRLAAARMLDLAARHVPHVTSGHFAVSFIVRLPNLLQAAAPSCLKWTCTALTAVPSTLAQRRPSTARAGGW